MTDVHSPETRSRNMAAIRAANTRPELLLRRALFAQGFRYKLHDKRLPGQPDLVFPKYRALVFVHGCFFHGHECAAFRWPSTRQEFWRSKIEGNRARDGRTVGRLQDAGWRVMTVWECALRGRHRLQLSQVITRISAWLQSNEPQGEISGRD